MPRFTIVPTDPSYPSAEIIAPNAAGALLMVQRLDYKEADILREGAYRFSVRPGNDGLWTIFQRDLTGLTQAAGVWG